MAVQFALIARFKQVTTPYGIDIILQYHRQIAYVATGIILAHPAILVIRKPELLEMLNPFGVNWTSRTGVWSVIAVLLVLILTLYRTQFRLNYEIWRISHALLGVAAVVLALIHVLLVGNYVNTTWKAVFWILFSAAMVGVVIHLRIVGLKVEIGRQ